MLYPRPTLQQAPRPVVVTGAGIITALGAGWAANVAGFKHGKKGFRAVTRFDVSRQRAKTAAEADLPAAMPSGRLSARKVGRMDYSGKLLLVAALEAWEQCGWAHSDDLPFVFGTTAAGMGLGEDFFRMAADRPQEHRLQATRVLHYQSHAQMRSLAEALGCGGPFTILSNACATGSNAIGQAWNMIRTGRAERVLAGGYEAICQTLYGGFDSLQALSVTTCRPFDKNRDGLSLGDGAGVVAMESLDSARRRGAEILGEVAGYGTVIDLHHLTQPHPEGDAAYRAMNLACESAGVTPDQVSYLNAHGTGTPLNDSSEALAINRWAGKRARTLRVSSTKAGVGHMLGASGAVEAIIGLMALKEQFLPPQLGLGTIDPVCTFPIVTAPATAKVDCVLSNSFGFGGINASLVLRRFA